MNQQSKEIWLQVTAGQGPVECAWAVVNVLRRMEDEAHAAALRCSTIEIAPGPRAGTAQSVLISVTGETGVAAFAESWRGTIQFTARSPFRPEHKRRNWFVGIDVLEPVDETRFDPDDIGWETMRASGPGGQHVNRTESAVRVTHRPTGLQASAMEERSQHRNRKLALARLVRKLDGYNAQRQEDARAGRRRTHLELERGNPVRVLRAP
ncbi:peptide chain release factor H [uncultured Paludibaculum sp.]|uniref:peptide chain release factor H n=1 Tax=uncultured Paludibaculum sp. TaxID=1765020 RepID=UPI002AAAD68F|nr:peptide chain release factor H [uncultured Paludibaculum sp.]